MSDIVVNSLAEARAFFLENSQGWVWCKRSDGSVLNAASYPDAIRLYAEDPAAETEGAK